MIIMMVVMVEEKRQQILKIQFLHYVIKQIQLVVVLYVPLKPLIWLPFLLNNADEDVAAEHDDSQASILT